MLYISNKNVGLKGLTHTDLVDNDFQLGISTKVFRAPTKKHFGEHLKEYENVEPSTTTIQIKSRPWNNKEDKNFWSKYGICCNILNKFHVNPQNTCGLMVISLLALIGTILYIRMTLGKENENISAL